MLHCFIGVQRELFSCLFAENRKEGFASCCKISCRGVKNIKVLLVTVLVLLLGPW
jgi:hypothetical protein